MKQNARVLLVLLACFAALLAACHLPAYPSAQSEPSQAEQSPLLQPQIVSPLPVVSVPRVSGPLDSMSSYHVRSHLEERHTLPDGSITGGSMEDNFYWTLREGQYGYDAHHVMTMGDLLSGPIGVIRESYVVDDLVYTYCSTCVVSTDQIGGWIVEKRNGDNSAVSTTNPEVRAAPAANVETMFGVWSMTTMPLDMLITESTLVGDESINGIATAHYRFTDAQALTEMLRMRIGSAPDMPFEVTTAQIDLWLTVPDQQPLQYTFQAEGKSEVVAGGQLQPFTIQDQYSVTEINSPMTITVPVEVLTAVETQLQALEGE